MADEPTYPHLSQAHYAQIVTLLLAGDVQARVVSGEEWMGVEVRQDAQRIYWTNVPMGLPWGWSVVDKETGKVLTGRSHIAADASPEDVALAIATMYDTPQDGPTL